MKTITKILLLFTFLSCQNNDKTICQKKSDLEKAGLKGEIEQVRQDNFKAIEKFGEIVKGEKWGFDDDNFYVKYNETGNQIEKNTYNQDGSLFSKFTFVYDKNGNLIEENRFNSDGTLNYKKKYKYFGENKMRDGNIYSSDGNLFSSDTTELDEKGNELKYHGYDKNKNIVSLFTNTYDVNANLITKDFVDRRTHINEVYKYDAKGNVLEENTFFHSSDMTMPVDTSRNARTIKYDEYNNKIEIVHSVLSSSSAPVKETFKYIYDDKKNWIQKISYKDNKPISVALRQIKYQ